MVSRQSMEEATRVIRQGGIVAFPTETYYGLAVDPFNEAALAKLYGLKGRPEHKPLLTLISRREQILGLAASIPACFSELIKLWPAPLTLIFPARPELSTRLSAGTGTVGIRMSPHPVAQGFVERCDIPLTATSANRSGVEAACTARQVAEQFPAGLDYILDGGPTPGGAGSTLIGCRHDRLVVLRRGVVDPDTLPGRF